jgi:type IV pilus assembly protein PilM
MAGATLVGLDIGARSIRAVEAVRGKDGPVAVGSGHVELPIGAVQAGVIQDEKAVTAALRHLWSVGRFKGKHVALGVANPQVIVREMTLPNLPGKELRKSLPFQVSDVLPLPVEESVLDFIPLEDPGRNETVTGLLVAAPKEAVLLAVGAIERAGLHVARVDLASFALLRAVSRQDGQPEAIVDIGGESTTVVIHTDGRPLIVRFVPRGGADVTAMIAARLDISAEQAEALKAQIGLRRDADPNAAEVVGAAVLPLISEIRSSFAYLSNASRPTRVRRLALCGGGSLLPGLVEALHEELGVEVALVDPAGRLRGARRGTASSLDAFRASAAVAVGLTLGAA